MGDSEKNETQEIIFFGETVQITTPLYRYIIQFFPFTLPHEEIVCLELLGPQAIVFLFFVYLN